MEYDTCIEYHTGETWKTNHDGLLPWDNIDK